MKQLISLLLAGCLVLGLAGCQKEASDRAQQAASTSASIPEPSSVPEDCSSQTYISAVPDGPAPVDRCVGQEPVFDGVCSAAYQIISHDPSLLDSRGKLAVDLRYDQIEVLNSPGAEKINAYFTALYEDFMARVPDFAAYTEEPMRTDYELVFENTYLAFVPYNMDGVFSVVLKNSWYMGGVSDGASVYCTFDLKTGEPLTLSQLLPGYDHELVYVQLRSMLEQSPTFGEAISVDRLDSDFPTLDALPFYVSADGEIILAFNQYQIAYGAAGPIFLSTGLFLS